MENTSQRRFFMLGALSGALSLAMAAPARASGGESKEAGNPSIQLASVGVPVTVDGKLVNYLFISVRINLTLKANESRFRDMEPYFRDALIHTSSKISFGQPGKDYLLDEPRFKQVMTAEWSKITGPGMIKSIDILAQSPKRHPQ